MAYDTINACTMTCPFNNSCQNLDIISTEILPLYPDKNNMTNLTSLSIECLEEESCVNLNIDCNAFGVSNCTVACLQDDACKNISLSCGDRSLSNTMEQCFIYTLTSDSAVAYSSISCNFSIFEARNDRFCGYKCGMESDGCYE